MSELVIPPLVVIEATGPVCTDAGCRVPGDGFVDAVDVARRFGGVDRLYGAGAHQALSALHVVVAGVGGVGTWCAEALARSGVGALTLVDLDHIAESNINRQVHALGSTLGQSKVRAMAARVRDINPLCRVRCVDDFADADNLAQILVPPEQPAQAVLVAADTDTPVSAAAPWRSVLVDCTDQVTAKVAMILQARAGGWPVLTCGGAGGKTDPLALRRGDLSASTHDALLARVRQTLRKRHGYPKAAAAGGKPRGRVPRMAVPCLWLDQPVILPAAWRHAGRAAGPAPVQAGPQGLSCAGYGSIVTVTASMGLAAADWAIRQGVGAAV